MNLCMLKKLLAIPPIALCLVGISLQASATPYTTCGEPGRLKCVVPIVGPKIPPPKKVPGKEISFRFDRDAVGVPDKEQNVAWDGIGGTADTFDYSGSRTILGVVDQDREVDALANSGDALYHEVIDNLAALLFSVQDDPNVSYEATNGKFGTWATPPEIDNMSPIRDTDGLEVWGGDGPGQDDANNYSLEDDSGTRDPNDVAVWNYIGGVSSPNWLTDEIALIVALASGVPVDLLREINLDAMMTTDPNEIMFSIDPVLARDGSTLLDGGEIFVGVRGVSGKYLFHGGHLWDTAFDVKGTFGLGNENINALEAVAPEPGILALFSLAGLILLFRQRRVA